MIVVAALFRYLVRVLGPPQAASDQYAYGPNLLTETEVQVEDDVSGISGVGLVVCSIIACAILGLAIACLFQRDTLTERMGLARGKIRYIQNIGAGTYGEVW